MWYYLKKITDFLTPKVLITICLTLLGILSIVLYYFLDGKIDFLDPDITIGILSLLSLLVSITGLGAARGQMLSYFTCKEESNPKKVNSTSSVEKKIESESETVIEH